MIKKIIYLKHNAVAIHICSFSLSLDFEFYRFNKTFKKIIYKRHKQKNTSYANEKHNISDWMHI